MNGWRNEGRGESREKIATAISVDGGADDDAGSL